jgi:hypothetical protein
MRGQTFATPFMISDGADCSTAVNNLFDGDFNEPVLPGKLRGGGLLSRVTRLLPGGLVHGDLGEGDGEAVLVAGFDEDALEGELDAFLEVGGGAGEACLDVVV